MQKSSCTTCGAPLLPTDAEERKGYATCIYCGASMKLEPVSEEDLLEEPSAEEKESAYQKLIETLNQPIERPENSEIEIVNEPGRSFEFRFPKKPYWSKNVIRGWLLILAWHTAVVLGTWFIVSTRTWPALFFLAVALAMTGWFWYYVFSSPGQTLELKILPNKNRITIWRFFFWTRSKKVIDYKNLGKVFFAPSGKVISGKNVFALYLVVDGKKIALFSGIPPSDDQRWIFSELKQFTQSKEPD